MVQTKKRIASANQRRILLVWQDFRCAICGEELTKSYQVDHIVPFSAGGKTTLENLQALCLNCHKQKSSQDGSRP